MSRCLNPTHYKFTAGKSAEQISVLRQTLVDYCYGISTRIFPPLQVCEIMFSSLSVCLLTEQLIELAVIGRLS